MVYLLKIFKAVTLLLVFMCFTTSTWGQDESKANISGTVTSSTGEALAGVTVVIKSANVGATTEVNGQYKLENITPGTYMLAASFIGFETQEKTIQVTASQNLEVDFRLQEKSFEVEGVEVIGKSATTQVNEQAYTVTAISTKELLNSTSDAKEILGRVSGVRVTQDGGLGSNASFSLNGFSGDQVKFFLDGLPMDNFSSSLSLSDIPVNSIERIEVYKGVVPVWLGTDALGGAVNIITNKKSNYLDASYSVGSFNTHRVSLNGAYTNPANGFTFRGSANYNYSDNNYKVWAPIVIDNNIERYAEVERFHDRYRSATLMLETGLTGRKYADNLLFGVIAAGNDQQVQTGATMGRVYGGIMRHNKSVVPTFKYSKDNLFTDGLNISLYSSYNITQSQVIDTLRDVRYNWLGDITYSRGSSDGEVLRTYNTMDDTDFNSQFNAGYTINPKHSLAFNYALSHFRRKAFDTERPFLPENKFPKSLNKQILGLAYKFDPTEKWSTTLFGKLYLLQTETSKEVDYGESSRRIEATEVSKNNLGYGLASTYFLLPALQLKASYEHTYRLPEAPEVFGDGLFINPNPDLGPEQSDNLNVGAAYGFKLAKEHQFNLESSFIYRESTDLIHQNVTIASPVTTYGNLSDVRTLGVEGSLRYEWKDMLHVGGNITFQDITDQADSLFNDYTGWGRNFNKGFRQPNTPFLFANANAGLTFKNLLAPGSALRVNYYYNFVETYYIVWIERGSEAGKEKYAIPRQTAHNLELILSFKNGKYNVSAELRNLTDALLYDRFYLQKPGRAFYLKLRYVL